MKARKLERVAIVGAGAMGSVYAALFRESGVDVCVVDTWREHVEAIERDGLRVEGASGDRTVRGIRATTDFSEAGPRDLVVIATKVSAVGAAASAIAPHLAPGATVLTIQNGLGALERIAEAMPTGNVLLGVADGFGASMLGPGRVHHAAMKRIHVGEIENGRSERAESLAGAWREAGFDARAYDDIWRPIWTKFLCNVTFSAPCTTFASTVGELMDSPDRWRIALGAMEEARAVAGARGVELGIADPVAYVTGFGRQMPDARPSMLLDHMAGRRSELDAINGRVPEMGRELGLPTPFNDTLVAVLRQREEAFGAPGPVGRDRAGDGDSRGDSRAERGERRP